MVSAITQLVAAAGCGGRAGGLPRAALLLGALVAGASALAPSSAALGGRRTALAAAPRPCTAPHVRRSAPVAVVTDEEASPATPARAPRGSALTEASELPDAPEFTEWFTNFPLAMSKTLARQSAPKPQTPMPGIWTWAWDTLPFLQPSKKGEDVSLGDTARTFKANIEQLFAGYPSRDGAPLAAADVQNIDLQVRR